MKNFILGFASGVIALIIFIFSAFWWYTRPKSERCPECRKRFRHNDRIGELLWIPSCECRSVWESMNLLSPGMRRERGLDPPLLKVGDGGTEHIGSACSPFTVVKIENNGWEIVVKMDDFYRGVIEPNPYGSLYSLVWDVDGGCYYQKDEAEKSPVGWRPSRWCIGERLAETG